MRETVIVSAVRTAGGKFGGALKDISASQLGTLVVKEALKRSGADKTECDELIFGNGWQAGVGPNVARQISVMSGLPKEVSAYTVNMRCGSGLKAVALASQAIKAGDADVVIAGGTENTSQVPYLLDRARWGYKMGDGKVIDSLHKDGFMCPLAECLMGVTGENLVEKYKITRDEQDEFALKSQQKAMEAINSGKFKDEIIGVEIKQKKAAAKIFEVDETPRPETTLEKLKSLKPVFKAGGTITAGTSSCLCDGASALVIMAKDKAEKLGVRPLATIKAYASVGVEPSLMGIGPVPAVKKVLSEARLTLDKIDLIEINEAFAAQVLAVEKELGWNPEKINVNGGAIALGHPIGATGAKILTTLIYEMKRRKTKSGLVTLCIGGGQGISMIVEGNN